MGNRAKPTSTEKTKETLADIKLPETLFADIISRSDEIGKIKVRFDPPTLWYKKDKDSAWSEGDLNTEYIRYVFLVLWKTEQQRSITNKEISILLEIDNRSNAADYMRNVKRRISEWFYGRDMVCGIYGARNMKWKGTVQSFVKKPSFKPSILECKYYEPRSRNPGTLLSARFGIVPFINEARTSEKETLLAWCDDIDSFSIRLFTGPGGSGKTRLFLEWCSKLDGWSAGFWAKYPSEEEIVSLFQYRDCFIVLDYAETRGDLFVQLKNFLELHQSSDSKFKLRIALLAREEAEWWNSLKRRDDVLRDLLEVYAPYQLKPVRAEESFRYEIFSKAFREFSSRIETTKKSPPVKLNLTDSRFQNILYIQIAALLELLQEDSREGSLLERVLDHETKFWIRGEGTKLDYEQRVLEERAGRAISALTLRGGASNHEEAVDLVRKVDGPRTEKFLALLRDLYPPCSLGEKNRERCYGYLEPDILGEALIVRVLSRPTTPSHFLQMTFHDGKHLERGFSILGRVSLVHPEKAMYWINILLNQDINERATSAATAALSLGKENAFSSLGQCLSEALECGGSLKTAEELEPMLPEDSFSLNRVNIWVCEKLIDNLPFRSKDKRRVSLFNKAATVYRFLGHKTKAFEKILDAFTYCQSMVYEGEDFTSELATSLDTMGMIAMENDEYETAIEFMQKAVDIRKYLLSKEPKLIPQIGTGFINIGRAYLRMDKYEKSIGVLEQGIEILRDVYQVDPNFIGQNLAIGLDSLGDNRKQSGDLKKALEAKKEAYDILKLVELEKPDQVIVAVALIAGSLARILFELKSYQDGARYASHSIDICRKLSKNESRLHLENLKDSLYAGVSCYSALGDIEKTISYTEEIVSVYNKLVKIDLSFFEGFIFNISSLSQLYISNGMDRKNYSILKEAFGYRIILSKELCDKGIGIPLSQFGDLLIKSGMIYNKLDNLELALPALEGALFQFQQIEKFYPGKLAPCLAASQFALGVVMMKLDRNNDSIKILEEAYEIRNGLALNDPENFLSEKAWTSTYLGEAYSRIGNIQKSIDFSKEAADTFQLLTRSSDEFQADLAGSLFNLALRYLQAQSNQDAFLASKESVQIWRELARENPVCLPQLGKGLSYLSQICASISRYEEFLSVTQEAIFIYRELDKIYPGRYIQDIAGHSINIAKVFNHVGDHDRALFFANESVMLYENLTKDNPDYFLEVFRSSVDILKEFSKELDIDIENDSLLIEASRFLAKF